jgi:flagella synthesis protein FlgN
MSLASSSDRDLARLLDEQIEAMTAVLDSLQSERAALATRDAEALANAVNTKQDSIRRATVVGDAERSALEELGSSRRRGAGDQGLSARWQRLVNLTRQCRALNEGNGLMINGQRRIVEQTLRLLRGEESPSTYGANGSSGPGRGGNRTLASI